MDDVQRMYMVLKPEVGKRKEMVKQSHDSGKEGTMESSHNDHDKEQEKMHANLLKNMNQEHERDHIKVTGTSKEEDVEKEELCDSSKSIRNDHEPKTNKGEGIKKDYVHSEGDNRIGPKEGSGHGDQKKQEGTIVHDKTSSDGIEHVKDLTLCKGREGGYGEEVP